MAARPSQSVLEAFGAEGPLRRLSGGRGLCYDAQGIVFKPSDDDAESQWVGETTLSLFESCSLDTYRLAYPLRSKTTPPSFTHEGWTAAKFIPGRATSPIPWRTILDVSRQLHADIRNLGVTKPRFLETKADRFHEADAVTWDEKLLSDVENVSNAILDLIELSLEKLKRLMKPIDNLTLQPIHGDLTGNILFAENSSPTPGIIDMTIYWRPAEYSEAIIVADGLSAHGQGRELLDMFVTNDVRLQLVVRALYWRALCFAIDPDMEFVEAVLPKMDFEGAARCVERWSWVP